MSARTLTVMGAIVVAIGAGALFMVPGEALKAQEGRYIVTPVEGGIMRVDRQSGEVSICKERRGNWSCELVPDDRQEMTRRMDRMERDNRRLRRDGLGERRRAERRNSYDDLDLDERDDLDGEGGIMSPEEVDKAMDAVDKMMKRFMQTARGIHRRMKEGDLEQPVE